jgi:hypothetical protein
MRKRGYVPLSTGTDPVTDTDIAQDDSKETPVVPTKLVFPVTEENLWNWMMDGNYPPGYPDMDRPELESLNRRAHATLSRDVQYVDTVTVTKKPATTARKGFRQPANSKTRANQRGRKRGKKMPEAEREVEVEVVKTMSKGSRVNVVMASRMGDVGITQDLEAEHGYVVRIDCVENEFMEQIRKPQGILIDIMPIEDPRPDKVKLAFPDTP